MTKGPTNRPLLVALGLLEEMSGDAAIVERVIEQLEALAASGSFRLGGSAAALLAAAGKEPPTHRLQPPLPAPAVTEDELRETLAYDYNQRTQLLAQLWNRFPQVVARGYWRIWRASERHKRIRKGQAETQISRSSRWVPLLHMHDWCREIVEVALDQSLPALRARLIQTGRWHPSMDDQIRDVLTPDAAASAARARSRILRPAAALPRERVGGEAPPAELQSGFFGGWTQVGFWERELVEEDRWSRGTEVTVRSGLFAGTPDGTNEWPWARPRGDFRWHLQQVRPALNAPAYEGALVEWWGQQDATAWEIGLTLRSDVRQMLGLTAAPLPNALDLVDADGAVGAVYRVWRMRPFNYDFGPTTPMITGGSLLLRPDLRTRLQQAADSLIEVTRVEREELTAPPEG
jgi:hypothetical protein